MELQLSKSARKREKARAKIPCAFCPRRYQIRQQWRNGVAIMGGHQAWRKRVEAGGLAKQSSGAICRRRPHFGRKGKDILKNKKGNIAGGPKKKWIRKKASSGGATGSSSQERPFESFLCLLFLMVLAILAMGFILVSRDRSTSSRS